MSLTWLLVGDCIQVLSASEKRGDGMVSTKNMESLRHMVSTCSLVDLGLSSCPFTWTNMRFGIAYIRECLDRAFANHNFVQHFVGAMVVHLTQTHVTTLVRRRRNMIIRLKNDHGVWCEDEIQLKDMATAFYQRLCSAKPVTLCVPYSWGFSKLTHTNHRRMNRSVNCLDIKVALFQLDGQKAPGPNGFTALFFQRFWEFVEKSLVDLVLHCFRTGVMPMGLNELVICLIPKSEAADSLNQF